MRMIKEYSIAEARNNLPGLVREAEQGRPIRLTRHGKPVAVVLSMPAYQRLVEPGSGLWQRIEAFRAANDVRDLDVESVFGDVRDRSPGREAAW
jgi:prevent-host-death family protein